MRTTIYEDEEAPRAERYRALREMDCREREQAMERNPEAVSWWITMESFRTKSEAQAFARGARIGHGLRRKEFLEMTELT